MKPVLSHLNVVIPFLFAGCATQPVVENMPTLRTANVAASQTTPDQTVAITRYELGAYRYPPSPFNPPAVAVERRTRVPASLASENQAGSLEYMPGSFDPLPKSAELAAELSAQREITARMQTSQQAMINLEQRARGQFETLVTQTDGTIRLREQLEAERNQVLELEAQFRARLRLISDGPTVPEPTELPLPSVAEPRE